MTIDRIYYPWKTRGVLTFRVATWRRVYFWFNRIFARASMPFEMMIIDSSVHIPEPRCRVEPVWRNSNG
jgi:hypothetical protein